MRNINHKLLKYVPESKIEAIHSIFHDKDGYWIFLESNWNADRMGYDCRIIQANTFKELRHQIGGIRKKGE